MPKYGRFVFLKKNEADIRELSDEITKGVEILYAESLKDVLNVAILYNSKLLINEEKYGN